MNEIERRRTFAIISHPDAGKTTLTEKLLLFGGQIQVAGAVKSNKIKKTATSDWMEIEKQRGISVSTSVMEFDYKDYKVNILDTPGHQDFAEDTFRTLTAVDSAIIVIDGAKGVEAQTRKLMTQKLLSPFDKSNPLPKSVISQLEQEYGMKCQRSEAVCRYNDRYTYGVLQFKGVYKKEKRYDNEYEIALALEVLVDGDKIYSYPVEGAIYDGMPTWNVDDEGEYISSSFPAAFQGPNGPELCFIHWAPESCTVGLFLIRNGKLERIVYEGYHSMIDEQTPLWKKDVAQLQKLFVADDTQENKDYTLSKYRYLWIDNDDTEEIWMRDKDDKHGAFFTRHNGEFKLIATENGRMHPTFLRSRDGVGYLRISGSAGGPSMFTQVFELKNSQVIHRFTALEIYGEIDECSFDGKPMDKEAGKRYMESLPEVNDISLWWNEIQN